MADAASATSPPAERVVAAEPVVFSAVPVVAAWDETAHLRGLALELPPALAESHRNAGQVLRVRTSAGDGYFALATAPVAARPVPPAGPEAPWSTDSAAGGAPARVELLVKRGGKVADAVVELGTAGAVLEVSPPFGKGFPVAEAEGQDLLFFAAGSGITAIRSLVQQILFHRQRYGRATLFYGQRTAADFAYQREHLEWERQGLRVVLCSSAGGQDWRGARGRVQDVAASMAFAGTLQRLDGGGRLSAVAFLCGMKDMVSGVRSMLEAAGLPPERTFLNF